MSKKIEKTIHSEFKNTQIPECLTIDIKDNEVMIELDGKSIVEDNMQVVGNAFEGWALVAHICSQKDVILSVKDKDKKYLPMGEYIGHGHFSRFIYRIMKFTDQYIWFHLENDLKKEVKDFRAFIETNVLVNNIPTKEAEEKDLISDENSVEAKLSECGVLREVLCKKHDIGEGEVYRQLPVGLFVGKKSKYTSVFTYGHSAIDLWKKDGNTINVIELKYQNSMIGIITEIFFYSNYMLDLVDENGLFTLLKTEGKKYRGYDKLEKGNCRIYGIMLADSYHPCVDNRCLDELNRNNIKDKLQYYKAEYRAEISVDITKIEKGL